NNRPILNRSDDSVMLPTNGKYQILRRSRGFVPSPITLPIKTIQTLGTGASLKITFSLTRGNQLFLSPYIGNSFSKNTIDFYFEMLEKYKKWYDIQPELIACDLQPDFYTTRFADEQNIPTIKVQHHHAHIASVMAEHKLDEPVIGIVYDGTGYGTDGNIWGGEIMIADYNKFERLFHLENMPLPGGDSAIRKPVRIAYAYLKKAGIDNDFLKDISELEKKIITKQIDNNFNTFQTSSMGRLFDCVSTMLGLFPEISFEAQSAMALQFLCNEKNILNAKIYNYEIENDKINIQQMLKEIVNDIHNGISKNKIAESFHNTIIQFTLEAVLIARKKSGIKKIVLSGGVMQNKILVENLTKVLKKNKFEFYIPYQTPTNDGAISVGQIMIGNKQFLET
ncbi:MAG: carbamoyltransferase HypF, partial [Candidatus Marinimicrobia bacterium]|nr:carbamoyltransferase HypF [Candidatus Neomarinimicrobiota bacterium]